MVRPYDPDALTQLTSIAAESSQKLTRLLERKQSRADELLGKDDPTEQDLKAARALEREVALIIDAVQDYKQIIQQHEAESESRWSMIQLQDKRCRELKQLAAHWKAEWTSTNNHFEALRAAFEAYVKRVMQKA